MLRWVWKPKRLSPILLELLMRNSGQSGQKYKPDKHNDVDYLCKFYSKEIIIFWAKIFKCNIPGKYKLLFSRWMDSVL